MFNPSRLTLARKRRGLKKTHLAREVGVSIRSITAYEVGDMAPTEDTVRRLSDVLGFPIEFFGAGDIEPPPPEGVSFRALKSLTAGQRDSAIGAGTLAMELSAWTDDRFSLPGPDLPDLSGSDPETAAEELRASWGLGEKPINNVIHLLEAHGVRVFSLAEECRQVDAFSFWWEGLPYVFLNTQKSSERSRFDAAHELGHLVLHREPSSPLGNNEREAQKFGGAFMMTRASVLASVSGLITVPSLIKLKRIWGVAVTALTYRLHEVGVVSDWHYRKLFKDLSALGYRINEPESIQRESSQVLSKVLNLLRQDGGDVSLIARDLHVGVDDINALMFGLAFLPVRGGATADTLRFGESPRLSVVPPKSTP